jgi:hypothetical protein
MALVVKDRVKVYCSTTGTGDLSLGSAFAGFQTFNNALGDGDTTYYGIFESSTGEFEVGIGTFTSSGNTLSRDTVLESSNTGAKVNLTADTEVFITYPAEKSVYFDANGDVNLTRDPQSALQAATKQYVDTIAAAGLHYHAPVRVEHPSNLTATYDNGTSGVGATLTNSGTQAVLVLDNVTMVVSDRVLIANQTNQAHNGVYTVTNIGSASTNWVLTRATDADSYSPSDPDALGEGDAFFIKEGDTNAGHLDVMTTSGTITFGTTNIVFSEVAETTVYSAGTGLSLSGTEFNVGAGTGITVDATSVSTVQDIATSATPTFDGLNTTGNITFGDSDEARFGAGSDLRIYHNGSNSIIWDEGVGNLQLVSSGASVDIIKAGGENMATFATDGAVTLYYDNAVKLATTSTGINVTGYAVADGLTLNNTATNNFTLQRESSLIPYGSITVQSENSGTVYYGGRISNYNGAFTISTQQPSSTNNLTSRIAISDIGDISFYEDTGTTAKFFWDASAENLGIRTASPVTPLHVSGGSATRADIQITTSATGEGAGDGFQIGYIDSLGAFNWNYENSDWYVGTNNNRRLTIDGSGLVGIGTSSPSSYHANADNLVIQDSGNAGITIATTDSAYFSQINFADGTSGAQAYTGILRYAHSDNSLRIIVNTGEKMRIDSSGNVGIGTSSPDDKLHVYSTSSLDHIKVDGPAAINRNVQFSTAGSARWNIYANSTAETGSNAGSNLSIARYADNGSYIGGAVLIERSTGNVGIGTTSPGEKLDVVGDARIRGSGTTMAGATMANASLLIGSTTAGIGIDSNEIIAAGDNLYLGGLTNGVIFRVGSTQHGAMDSSGNFGFGTTTPSQKLHVQGGQLRVSNGSDFYINSIAGQSYAYTSSTPFDVYTSGAHRYRFGTTGYLSIFGAVTPETHAYLNIGSAGSGETRAIDIDGSWSTNENKSISFTYGADSTNMVGQWNVQHNGPASRMRWGKLYHGADSSTYTMELVSTSTTTADLTVSGSISATTKSFVIDHPTKEGMKLRHGSLEGPEDGVYVRGRLTGETVIELPDYWTGLVHEDSITVQLTAMGGKADLWVESIADNKVTVGCDTEVDCFYFVQATRKDVDAWEVEYVADS